MPPAMQRVGAFSELPGLLREYGVRPSAVLRRVDLAVDALADRENRIPYSKAAALLAACAEATGCRHFGLLAGSRWRLEHMGLPGEIAGSCATVGAAIEAFTTLHWLNSSGGVAYLAREEGVTTLGYAIYELGLPEGWHHVHDCVIAIGVRMLRELTGRSDWAPLQVQLSHSRPDDVPPYRRFFGAPVRFDAEITAIHFPTAFEATRVLGGDETRHRALEAKLLAAGREALLPRLHRMIRVAMLFGLSSGDDVAAAMALTRRTFNRRLAEYGTTFQEALDTVRHEVARQLLQDTTLSVADVAAALGYAEPSTFVRAFRRWTGETPGQWRQQVRHPPKRDATHGMER
jgi:AraC-like DNA-binding protein